MFVGRCIARVLSKSKKLYKIRIKKRFSTYVIQASNDVGLMPVIKAFVLPFQFLVPNKFM